jgi:hypothetical protein
MGYSARTCLKNPKLYMLEGLSDLAPGMEVNWKTITPPSSPKDTCPSGYDMPPLCRVLFLFLVLGLEPKTYTLSHSTSPFFE